MLRAGRCLLYSTDVRQIIGWREFIRGVYLSVGGGERKSNSGVAETSCRGRSTVEQPASSRLTQSSSVYLGTDIVTTSKG